MAEFSIEHRAALTYVGLAVDVTMDTIPERVAPAFDDLARYLDERGIATTGPSVMRYGRIMMTAPFTMQIGFAVEGQPWIDHPYSADRVPAGTYVVGRQDGPYANLGQLTERTMAWGDEQGVAYALEVGTDGARGDGDTWEAWYEWYPVAPTYGEDGPHGPVEVCLLVRD
ncbi:GyrI-like domain-containing protein [Demequina sp. NBRC 110055]|uniref:GyrI-like domain-containing protein n=1 Tax=Demequina sp. NBRC 110055 TaxID=1570344 RepID=UPI0009FC8355|nr:GyrI-like domain-containing protein [Demequina sp. NBRC 110055]